MALCDLCCAHLEPWWGHYDLLDVSTPYIAIATADRLRAMGSVANDHISLLALSMKRKTLAYRMLSLIVFGVLGLSFFSSIMQSIISSQNYPGGVALQRLHELELDQFAAGNGTRDDLVAVRATTTLSFFSRFAYLSRSIFVTE